MSNKGRSVAAGLMAVFLFSGNGRANVDRHTHPHPGPVASDQMGHMIPQDLLNRLDVGFLLEVEAFASKEGGVNESDITLATAELTLDAEFIDALTGHLGLLWEENETEENNLDEAFVTFGSTDDMLFYVSAGRMYLPFGNFESIFISDPITLELAEIRESAMLIGYEHEWIEINAGAFNGDYEGDTGENVIDGMVASVSFTPCDGLSFGVYWLSDLLETDGFERIAEVLAGDYDTYEAAGAYLNGQLGIMSLSAEVVGAMEEVGIAGDVLRPMAYNIELSSEVAEQWTAGVKFEGSNDFYGDIGSDRFADSRSGIVVSRIFNEHLILSGEYLHAAGLDNDESADTVILQMALVL